MTYERDIKSLKKAYSSTFNGIDGEKVLDDLKSAYFNTDSFSENPHKTAYQCGQRSVVLRIINLLNEKKGD